MQLEARRITKRHPGVIALDGVSALFRGGECHAVVGENGAGKSTLMRVLSGASQPDEGTLLLDDDAIVLSSPHAAQLLGIRMIHQELALVPDLTVADNILLGAEPSRRGILNRAYQDDLARTALVRLGQQHIDVHARPRDLSLAAQQMVEIAKAVAARTTMLILDEPTAILSLPETVRLFVVLNELRSSGVAIVYVSHRMDEVFELADRITVLRDGRLVSTAAIGELARADVVRDMVGRTLAEGYPPAIGATDKEVLRVEGLSSGLARNVSFRLCAGEAVALVGLVGSGRTDVLRAIFGAAPLVAGAMWLGGSPYAPRTPRDAIARGVALVPEDRKHLALIPDRVVRENISLATIGEYATHGVIQHNAERAAVREWTDTLGVRESATEARVDTLSGGNQQKTVFARSMLTDASVMLIDEPTRGVDVGAKSEIYDLIRAMTARGVAVILVSSELPEALGLADRVLAMRNGELVAELRGPDCTAGIVGPIILGETATAA